MSLNKPLCQVVQEVQTCTTQNPPPPPTPSPTHDHSKVIPIRCKNDHSDPFGTYPPYRRCHHAAKDPATYTISRSHSHTTWNTANRLGHLRQRTRGEGERGKREKKTKGRDESRKKQEEWEGKAVAK